jgi:hypothetical protein
VLSLVRNFVAGMKRLSSDVLSTEEGEEGAPPPQKSDTKTENDTQHAVETNDIGHAHVSTSNRT